MQGLAFPCQVRTEGRHPAFEVEREINLGRPVRDSAEAAARRSEAGTAEPQRCALFQ